MQWRSQWKVHANTEPHTLYGNQKSEIENKTKWNGEKNGRTIVQRQINFIKIPQQILHKMEKEKKNDLFITVNVRGCGYVIVDCSARVHAAACCMCMTNQYVGGRGSVLLLLLLWFSYIYIKYCAKQFVCILPARLVDCRSCRVHKIPFVTYRMHSHRHIEAHVFNHFSKMQWCNLVQLFWAAKMPKKRKNEAKAKQQKKRSKCIGTRTWEWETKWTWCTSLWCMSPVQKKKKISAGVCVGRSIQLCTCCFFFCVHRPSESVSIQLAFGVEQKCANVWPQLWHLTSCYRCCRLSLDFFSLSFCSCCNARSIFFYSCVWLCVCVALIASWPIMLWVCVCVWQCELVWLLLVADQPTGQPLDSSLYLYNNLPQKVALCMACIYHHRCAPKRRYWLTDWMCVCVCV